MFFFTCISNKHRNKLRNIKLKQQTKDIENNKQRNINDTKKDIEKNVSKGCTLFHQKSNEYLRTKVKTMAIYTTTTTATLCTLVKKKKEKEKKKKKKRKKKEKKKSVVT